MKPSANIFQGCRDIRGSLLQKEDVRQTFLEVFITTCTYYDSLLGFHSPIHPIKTHKPRRNPHSEIRWTNLAQVSIGLKMYVSQKQTILGGKSSCAASLRLLFRAVPTKLLRFPLGSIGLRSFSQGVGWQHFLTNQKEQASGGVVRVVPEILKLPCHYIYVYTYHVIISMYIHIITIRIHYNPL